MVEFIVEFVVAFAAGFGMARSLRLTREVRALKRRMSNVEDDAYGTWDDITHPDWRRVYLGGQSSGR